MQLTIRNGLLNQSNRRLESDAIHLDILGITRLQNTTRCCLRLRLLLPRGANSYQRRQFHRVIGQDAIDTGVNSTAPVERLPPRDNRSRQEGPLAMLMHLFPLGRTRPGSCTRAPNT